MYLVTKGITEALRPRLVNVISSEEMDELENKLYSLMNHSDEEKDDDLGSGSEFLLIVKGDTMYYSRHRGGGGGDGGKDDINVIQSNDERKIQHQDFCNALCDVYYGNDAVSADHKESVIDGITQLLVDTRRYT